MLFLFLGGLIYHARAGIAPFAPRRLSGATFRKVRRDALKMSGYQVAFTVSSQTDMILIGIFLGSAAAAPFGIAHRVFSLMVTMGATLNQAQWPAMAKADAAGARDAYLPLFRRTLILVPLGAASVAVTIALLYQPLIELWLGETVATDPWILWGMVVWVLIATAANTCASLLRARNETSFLMRAMGAMAGVNLVLTLILLPILGPAGAIWGSVIGYCSAVLLPYLWKLRHDILGDRA